MSIQKRSTASLAHNRVSRAAEVGSGVVRGYGAVFWDQSNTGTQYQLWENCFERIRPAAFDRAIAEKQDVRALFNHDPSWVLGRLSAGTLRLSIDALGLGYEIDQSTDDPQWASVASKIDRGDIDGSSFSFRPRSVTWEQQEIDGSVIEVRWINDVDLFDVGPVTFPAYDAAGAGRSGGVCDQEHQSLLVERNRYFSEIESVAIRQRIASL